ncbi:unnamed protein product [Pieris macdunnoughi]|uniref:Retrotransposon gag domain-containing protein n=1 Tax=Pieris macdunnoughi TaxID=345717 RepID=A0A821UWU0_9NEOP|nr:unnamed protein product [Pieris macdunnoughi]
MELGWRVEGNAAQNLYLFHAITSRLVGKAATLLSENQNITSWDHFKDILTQHFGDPRSEECIAIELESLKIKSGESYIEFCQRIQSVKSSLTSKVNRLTDESIKAAKLIIYNNTALNVFLYNLSEDLLRIVRLKGCTNLESALSVVTEEVNFHYQYSIKNKLWKNSASPQQNNFKPGIPSQNNFKPGISPQNNLASNVPPQNNFKYGIPPQNNLKYGIPPQNHVKFGMPTQNNFKFGIPPQNNFKFGIPPQNNFKFGMPPQNNYRFGISPQNNSRFGIPQQNYKFGYQPQQGPRFGIPHQKQNPQPGNTDVSMRTAPIRQNMINDSEYYYEPYYYNDYSDYDNYDSSETAMCENFNLLENQENSKDNEEIESQEVNFQEEASNHIPK